jgi:hypothetical protein
MKKIDKKNVVPKNESLILSDSTQKRDEDPDIWLSPWKASVASDKEDTFK